MTSPDARAKFGKHKGKTWSWINKYDWKYLQWAKLNVPNLFEDKPQSRSVSMDQNVGESSWMKIPSIPYTMKEDPPERDDNDPNSSSFMYNIAKRMLDNGEL